MHNNDLTHTQERTLRAIIDFIACKHFPPTLRELADLLGITSPSLHRHLKQLTKKGYLDREPNKARGLAVVRQIGEAHTAQAAIPLIGNVQAGAPMLAEENLTGEITVDGSLARRGQCFAMTVKGNCMTGAGIHAGEVLVIRKQPVAANGDIVVAIVDGATMVKRLYIMGDSIELRPANPNFPTIEVNADTELKIIGKVIATKGHSRGLPLPRPSSVEHAIGAEIA